MTQKKFSYIRSLSRLHAVFLGGQCVLALILTGLVYFGHLVPYPFERISGTVAFYGATISVFCRLGSQYLYKSRISKIRDNDQTLQKKLGQYMSANWQRWVIMEFAILGCMILIYLSGNWMLIVITLLMIALFLGMRPGTAKIFSELEIDVAAFI